MARELVVSDEQRSIHAEVLGAGPAVVLIPSLGRGAEDFFDLKQRLVDAGFQVILPQPRGIGASTGSTRDITLYDLAEDVHQVVRSVTDKPVVVLGHAFGNRVARAFGTRYPEQTKGLILLAAGSAPHLPPEITKALRDSFRGDLPEDQHLAAIKLAFFAEGNDPATWRSGWYAQVAQYQEQATRAAPAQEWWAGGEAPLLVIQPVEDRVAPPENAAKLQKEFPQRVQVRMLEKAGHASLPEQPQQIARYVTDWLRQQH
ncbi:alpha/beta fold hydrolase [Pseudomonas sp. NPDC090755]|uniref:alpha/beta fold hydrolase n=1 Tax=Pseudomonas sp. NPDC090755 TaxID=3364481 RepID=UPI00383AEC6A